MDPLPDEPTPRGGGSGAQRAFSVQNYGLLTWGQLFNARQMLTLLTFAENIKRAYANFRSSASLPGTHRDDTAGLARAVALYLALMLDRLAASYNILCRWQPSRETIADAFSRGALPMIWSYAEANPFGTASRSWGGLFTDSCAVISWLSQAGRLSASDVVRSNVPSNGRVVQGSAVELPWPSAHFDAIITDPPYYDNVPYSYLADFFYVWLKRTVGDLYPGLFATPLTPKVGEIVAYAQQDGGFDSGKRYFEDMIQKAFTEMSRVLKPDGLAVIVFAHKSTEAWETIVRALLEAGLYMTASWPIRTEMKARLRAQESAVVASSVYMVCRKRNVDTAGEYARVRDDIAARIRERLTQFWDEGIRGADFFMSAIGPAVEVFGRYARVEKLSGEPVTVSELLDYVQQVVAEFALERVMQSPNLGGVDADTRFYLLWRWTYNHARVPFDEANKLARAVGAEISELWSRSGFVQKDKEYVRVLGPKDRAGDDRFLERERSATLVDALHKACLLWESGQRAALNEHLLLNRGNDETFWRVAQAISDVLPSGDKEKQLLQGLIGAQRMWGGQTLRQPGLFDAGGNE